MPTISVIVPVYNTEKYLSKCIDSILAQTYTDFELLLIDDGSPDRSGAICDEYAKRDTRIRVFHKPNGGVSSARNMGLDNARGEWITFVDSDDTIVPNFLNVFFSNNKYYDLYIQGYCIVEKGRLAKEFKLSESNATIQDILAYAETNSLFNTPVCKLFSANVIRTNDIKFDVRTSYGEDHLFVLDYVTHCHSIYCSSAVGYIYNHHNNSLTTRIVPLEEILYYIDSLNTKIETYSPLFNLDIIQKHFKEICSLNLLRAIQSFFSNPLRDASLKKYDYYFSIRLNDFYLSRHSIFTNLVGYTSKMTEPFQYVIMLLLFRMRIVIQRLRER